MDLDKLLPTLFYADNVNFKTIFEDGLKIAVANGLDSFEYKVGEIGGQAVKVILESNEPVSDMVMVDGVEGFGYTLVGEKPEEASTQAPEGC